MTLDEVKKFYGSCYNYKKLTGMSPSNFGNWLVKGYIPIKAQIHLEHLSKGALRAEIPRYGDESENE